ncbi:MAG: hypothetical protein BWY14_01331 [Parcubacteria group bacterium ADurb.Bin192]|nr:MAG: hypothetical protein BWY14_01331 [Parcubacteria group bacterium ADurb.Bin192]
MHFHAFINVGSGKAFVVYPDSRVIVSLALQIIYQAFDLIAVFSLGEARYVPEFFYFAGGIFPERRQRRVV